MKTKERLGYDTNRATLPKADAENARNYGGDKEEVNRLRVIVFDAKARSEREHHSGLESVVEARFWMGRSAAASVVYCSVWLHGRRWANRCCSGRGSAGGSGYHKESAALEDALSSAGVKLAGNIGGCGERPMSLALAAVARAMGYHRCPMEVV